MGAVVTAPHWLGIAGIGAAYRAGTLDPITLVDALLARIAVVDPQLHCFIRLDIPAVRAAAIAATQEIAAYGMRGPLHGVPVGIKDVIDVAGLPTTCHSRLRLDDVAASDAAVVARLRGAGAIIFGKLATHEFAIGGPAFDLPFPPARNPWNIACHPGGSSSGAGAAVAAGLIPAAVGTDTAGSVRNPASACGIVGLKPTRDAVSCEGVFPLAWSLDHVGPLTRSVEDAALMLAAMTGVAYDGELLSDVAGLRIGVVRHFHEVDLPAGAETAAAFDRVADMLTGAGAVVTPVVLPSLNEFAAVNRIILAAEGFTIHRRDLCDRPGDYAAITRRTLLVGAFLTAEDYVSAMRRRVQMTALVEAAFKDVDVLLTASSMEPACRIDDEAEIARTYLKQARTPFNLTGHPALAMMSGLSAAGLPLSVQFVGRLHDEARLFRVAAAWQRAFGSPRPPLSDSSKWN